MYRCRRALITPPRLRPELHILRDILMVCEPLLYGEALTKRGQKVYYYDQNQTVVDGPLESLGLPGLGVVHTSEFAYMFNNISHYHSKQSARKDTS